MSGPDWHDRARKMREAGASLADISDALHRCKKTLAYVLDVGDTRKNWDARKQREADRARLRRERLRGQPDAASNWQEEAIRLRTVLAMNVKQIAREIGVRDRTVGAFIADYERSRDTGANPRALRGPIAKPITLPKISAGALPDVDEPVVRRFAPKSRVVITGADRYRHVAESMRRRGLLQSRDVLAEMGLQ